MALYTEAELKKKTKVDLLELAEKHDLDIDSSIKKAEVVEALLDLEDEVDDTEEELDDDELDDDAEEEDDSEVDDEEEELDDEEEVDDEEEEVDEPEPKPAKKSKAKKPKTNEEGEPTLAAKQVAHLLGTDAKLLRQFFRSEASTTEAVGSGGRYEFLETDVPKIKEEFEAWKAAHAARGSKRGRPKGSKNSTPSGAEVEEVEEIEELEMDDDELEDDEELDDDELELDDEEDE